MDLALSCQNIYKHRIGEIGNFSIWSQNQLAKLNCKSHNEDRFCSIFFLPITVGITYAELSLAAIGRRGW